VAIDVAIALAVSWNPLVKSNSSAVATTAMTTTDASIHPPEFDFPPLACSTLIAVDVDAAHLRTDGGSAALDGSDRR
jgi:hypothetical protein